MPIGVYKAFMKDHTEYYRASVTYKNKHISLGSYFSVNNAEKAYKQANLILYQPDTAIINTHDYSIDYNPDNIVLPFEKWVILINFRDNGIYIKTPIYLCNKFFIYFLTPEKYMIFDVDDLFYYSTHKIMARNGYLFVNDYGMQINLLSRYGIHNHAVKNRDYKFSNGNEDDYRYDNIKVLNPYVGVQSIQKKGKIFYKAKIHILGDYVIGTYQTEHEAAAAYNKTIDLLHKKGIQKNYTKNYIEDISPIEYAAIYNSVKISKRIREL